MLVEVRCCCQPVKLLGWINLPLETVMRRGSVSFVALEEAPRVFGMSRDERCATQVISLPFADYINDFRHRDKHGRPVAHPALKSNDYPLETLRKIPGFVPHPDALRREAARVRR